MKKVVTVQDVEGEGLLALLDKNVVLWCMNYIYSGKLVGVNDTCVLLEDACVVYSTGELTAKSFKDAQPCAKPLYVMSGSIESFSERGF
jgi:hypothetical protein